MDSLAPMLEDWLEKRLGTTRVRADQKVPSNRKEDKGLQGRETPQQPQGDLTKSSTREREDTEEK